MKTFLPVYTLWQREIVRFYRQRSRVVGAILPPLIFWFLIGSGLGGSFRHGSENLSSDFSGAGGVNYLQYFFPGTIVMIVLFTSIFSTISIIEDRK
jgi:ABC-2 type transport system permease protein